MITADLDRPWILDEGLKLAPVIRELASLPGRTGTAYFEGVTVSPEAAELLQRHAVAPENPVERIVRWPRSHRYHVSASTALVDDLAQLSRSVDEAAICNHLVILDDGAVLAAWFDVPDGPVLISRDADEATVRQIASRLQSGYARGEEAG